MSIKLKSPNEQEIKENFIGELDRGHPIRVLTWTYLMDVLIDNGASIPHEAKEKAEIVLSLMLQASYAWGISSARETLQSVLVQMTFKNQFDCIQEAFKKSYEKEE